MRSRRGAVTTCVAAFATAFAHVALVDGCGEFGVADGTNDAGASPGDAMNGGFEGAPGDADAPRDGGAVGDAGASDAACGMHDFCADFEQVLPVDGWADVKLGGGGKLFTVPDAGVPGNALMSTIPATAAQAAAYAYVVEPFAGALGLHVELEINAPTESLAPSGDVTILEISGEAAMAKSSGVGVVLRSMSPSLGFYIARGDGTFDTPVPQLDLPRGGWVHVALDFRFGAAGTLKLLLDGNTALDAALVTVVPPTPELRVGIQHYNGASPAFSALYDTVRVDILK